MCIRDRKWADSKYGPLALGLMALAEASFFPIPPDVLLIALCLGSQNKSFRFALICSLGSILGAIIGYGIGSFLWWSSPSTFTPLANFFFNIIPGFSSDVFYSIKTQYEQWNFWIIFTVVAGILGAMFGNTNIPVEVRGAPSDLRAFVGALGGEKNYINSRKLF